ncbi:MAG: hypothetical protein IKW90_10960 [Lachnospiraceae bacterium]|nr:hypothetical protein [Lachnospiraceae bacterium]
MIKIRLKNRPYGFIYSDSLPQSGYTEVKIPAAADRVAITGDYFEIADNHCAAICTMNTMLLMRQHGKGDIRRHRFGNDFLEIFKDIHKIVGNGPIIFYKPKFNRYFKSKGSKVHAVPISRFEDIENAIREKTPVPMMVNAGISHWHWILVIGIRKYMDGSIYLNILDGWNKRTDRYLRYNGRETFIRALKPTFP